MRVAVGCVHQGLGADGVLPWKLARSDPVAAAETLSQEEKKKEKKMKKKPEDLATSKLWRLLKAGLPAAKLQEVAVLLKGAPWSSMLVAQAHGSAAVVQKLSSPGLGLALPLVCALLIAVLTPNLQLETELQRFCSSGRVTC